VRSALLVPLAVLRHAIQSRYGDGVSDGCSRFGVSFCA
jgi:hypothetical protein